MQSSKKRNNRDSKDTSEKPSGSRKEETAASGSRSSARARPAPRLRRGRRDDDDSSVDSRGNLRNLIAYSEESEDEEVSTICDSSFEESDSEIASPKRRKPATRAAALKARKEIARKLKAEQKKKEAKKSSTTKTKKQESEEEESADTSSELEEEVEEATDREEDEDEVDEDEDFDEEDDEEEEQTGRRGGISISFGTFGSDSYERMIPQRHNMKKESEIVKKFVKLVTNPVQENTIDDQIDQFKALQAERQNQMIEALERKNKPNVSEQPLMFRILSMNIPQETQTMILNKYNSLQTLDTSSGEYFKLRNWLEKFTSIPLGIYKEMPVSLNDGSDKCGAFMERAKKAMEDAIYGQDEAKLQILQFIASKIANPNARGLSLLLLGPPGIGKTSLIKNGIAKALDWPFQFISLGGDSDATTYTGHQLVYESSHCGKIVNSLVAAKSMSMVLMFDELDKISGTPKGEEVQNMLIHLTDPVQNADFEDKYLAGVPIDLSKVMFIFSGNDINKIDKILLDRMVVVNLNGYSTKEKQAIAELYLVPQALKEVNLAEKVGISSEVIQHIIREYSGEETGVRELKRSVEGIVQKINMLRIFNSKDLPFHIKDFSLPFVVKKEHVDLFLKKKEPSMSISVQRMYT